jgi:hypothetical protein
MAFAGKKWLFALLEEALTVHYILAIKNVVWFPITATVIVIRRKFLF